MTMYCHGALPLHAGEKVIEPCSIIGALTTGV